MSNPNILYDIVLKIKNIWITQLELVNKKILRPNFYLIYFY